MLRLGLFLIFSKNESSVVSLNSMFFYKNYNHSIVVAGKIKSELS